MPGPRPKDIAFATCARESTCRTGKHRDSDSQARASLTRRRTAERELAWETGDLGSRAGSSRGRGLRQALGPAKPQVFLCEIRLPTPTSFESSQGDAVREAGRRERQSVRAPGQAV